MSNTIKAVATRTNGEPERLVLVDLAAPVAQSGERILNLARAGVNFIDVYQARGQYPVPPGTVLGFEAVGIAADGKRYAVINHFGTYAQRVAVPEAKLIPVPDDVSDDAAMMLFQGVTAQYLTTTTHPLRAGETVLIYAAAGGVGSILLQLVKAAGARPIGVVSSQAKAQPLRERGYEILVGDPTNVQLVREAVPEGVDVAFDANGADSWELTLASMKPRGHIVTFGSASGEIPAFKPTLLRDRHSLTLTYPSIMDHVADRSELLARAEAVFTWLRNGTLVPAAFTAFPLERALDAHALLESRRSSGKILLVP